MSQSLSDRLNRFHSPSKNQLSQSLVLNRRRQSFQSLSLSGPTFLRQLQSSMINPNLSSARNRKRLSFLNQSHSDRSSRFRVPSLMNPKTLLSLILTSPCLSMIRHQASRSPENLRTGRFRKTCQKRTTQAGSSTRKIGRRENSNAPSCGSETRTMIMARSHKSMVRTAISLSSILTKRAST